MPHVPVGARPQFHQKTSNPKKGFGASVAEISWSTGEILDHLKKEGLAENTLVIFTSDNGGAPHWGASNGVLKGR
jgi:arylsulfatase A